MLEPMFEIPGTNIRKVTITEDVIMGTSKPQYSEMSCEDTRNPDKSTGDYSNDSTGETQDSSNNKERAINK